MFAVHHKALVEVVLLARCIHGAEGGEDSLGHNLAERRRRVMLRDGVFVVHACQDFVCAREDFLGELTSFAIQGDVVVVLDKLVVDPGRKRLRDGVLIGGGTPCYHRCRCRGRGRCNCRNAGLVLHLDDLIEDYPRRCHGVRVLGAQLVLRSSDGDPGCQFLDCGLYGVDVLEVDCNGAGGLNFDGFEVCHHGVCVEVHSGLLCCQIEVGICCHHGAVCMRGDNYSLKALSYVARGTQRG